MSEAQRTSARPLLGALSFHTVLVHLSQAGQWDLESAKFKLAKMHFVCKPIVCSAFVHDVGWTFYQKNLGSNGLLWCRFQGRKMRSAYTWIRQQNWTGPVRTLCVFTRCSEMGEKACARSSSFRNAWNIPSFQRTVGPIFFLFISWVVIKGSFCTRMWKRWLFLLMYTEVLRNRAIFKYLMACCLKLFCWRISRNLTYEVTS